MEQATPTTIVLHWLTTNPEKAAHLREVFDDDGLRSFRDETENYFQEQETGHPDAEALAAWGVANGPPLPTRYRVLEWVMNHVDWEAAAASLPPRVAIT